MFTIPYCCWKQKKEEQAIESIDAFYPLTKDEFQLLILRFLKELIQSKGHQMRNTILSKYVSKIIEESKKQSDLNTHLFCYQIISDAYGYIEDYKNQNKYFSKMIMLKNNEYLKLDEDHI